MKDGQEQVIASKEPANKEKVEVLEEVQQLTTKVKTLQVGDETVKVKTKALFDSPSDDKEDFPKDSKPHEQ